MAAFRDAFLKLSTAWNKERAGRAFLVLVEPAVSEARLHEEWSKAKDVLSRTVADSLCLVVIKDGEPTGDVKEMPSSLKRRLNRLCKSDEIGRHLKRPKYQFEVLKLLVRQWLLGKGPVKTKWLMEKIDCSYPTVARVLDGLRGELRFGPYRTIELARFPHKAWQELLALSDEVRATVRFKDTSGQPRSPKSLLKRLMRLDLENVALGGTMGAREWHPLLDLEGDPRFDICVHAPGSSLDLDFVEKLDPALREIENPKEPASLVVHVVRRQMSFFDEERAVGRLADPVECLLDLHELRLESQAREFVKFLSEMRR